MLYDTMRMEEKLLLKEFRDLGIGVSLINIDELSLDLERGGDELGVVLVRPMSHSRAGVIARILNIHGVRTINKGLAIENSWNKAIAISMLARAGIPTVPTKLLLSVSALHDGVNYPAIVKPVHGSWGRLVSLVGSAEDLAMIMRHKAAGETYLRIAMVQPFIGDGTDYRVFIVGDEVVASMVRRPSGDDWRSNVARGGRAEAVRLGDDVHEIAIKAVKALDLDYAGVDLLHSEDRGYLVNEVNAIPEFKGLMSVSGINIARKIVEYVIYTARR